MGIFSGEACLAEQMMRVTKLALTLKAHALSIAWLQVMEKFNILLQQVFEVHEEIEW